MAFEGKTLAGKRKTRGVDDPMEQMESFLHIYNDFHSSFQTLAEGDQGTFETKGDELIDDKKIGACICSGDEDRVREELNDLEKPDAKIVMKFLIDEKVI